MNHGCSLEACRGFGRVEEVAPSDLKWSVKRKRGSLARLLWRIRVLCAVSLGPRHCKGYHCGCIVLPPQSGVQCFHIA